MARTSGGGPKLAVDSHSYYLPGHDLLVGPLASDPVVAELFRRIWILHRLGPAGPQDSVSVATVGTTVRVRVCRQRPSAAAADATHEVLDLDETAAGSPQAELAERVRQLAGMASEPELFAGDP